MSSFFAIIADFFLCRLTDRYKCALYGNNGGHMAAVLAVVDADALMQFCHFAVGKTSSSISLSG